MEQENQKSIQDQSIQDSRVAAGSQQSSDQTLDIRDQIPEPAKTPKPKKTKILILIMLFILATGLAYWFVLRGKDSQDANELADSTSVSSLSNAFDPAVKLPSYADRLKSKHAQISEVKMYTGTETQGVILYSEKISYNVELESPDNWSGIINLSDDNTAPYDDLVNMFKDDGFTDYTQANKPDMYGDPGYLVLNNIICVIDSYTDQIIFSCADVNEFDNAADKMKPFYDAFIERYPESSQENRSLLVSITSGGVQASTDFPDYEFVIGGSGDITGGGGGRLVFYRANGGKWKYGYGGHEIPSCSAMTDKDAQKALSSHNCFDGSYDNDTTLKEYYNL